MKQKKSFKSYRTAQLAALLLSLLMLLSACAAQPGAAVKDAIPAVPSDALAQAETPAQQTEAPVQTPAQTASATTAPSTEPSAAPVQYSKYKVEVDADPEQARVQVRLALDYVNDTPDDLYELTLRLWPNAIYAGCLSLTSVTQEDEDSYYTLSMNDSALTIPINRDLHPGDRINFGIAYTVKVPELDGRFGVNKLGMNLGNLLPAICLYENGAWRLDEYQSIGDPFYSECAEYEVLIRCPQRYAVAASGEAGEAQYLDEKGLYEGVYTAKPARDFAISLVADCFMESAYSEKNVRVSAYTKRQSYSKKLAETSASALSYFEAKLGDYPYRDFCAVGTAITGGMEYPGLILINYEGIDNNEKAITELFIAHEVAHQWFYNELGTDQVRAPWVDEALVEFLSYDYIRSKYGEEYMRALWDSRFHDINAYTISTPLDASLADFAKAPAGDYVYGVYARGSAFYDALYAKLGEEKFYDVLGKLVKAKRFGLLSGTELLAAFSEAAGEDITPLFDTYKNSQPNATETSVQW